MKGAGDKWTGGLKSRGKVVGKHARKVVIDGKMKVRLKNDPKAKEEIVERSF